MSVIKETYTRFELMIFKFYFSIFYVKNNYWYFLILSQNLHGMQNIELHFVL